MKHTSAQSATSLPRAPRDDAHTRIGKYFSMMAIRVVCFVLMVAIQPYGWYTWLFAIGAVLLPYFAVVIANVAAAPAAPAVPPERAIEAPPSAAPRAAQTPTTSDTPTVVRIHEAPRRPEDAA